MIDFPTWFSDGCYGGLACCLLASVVCTVYTTLGKRGTTRQLALALVVTVASALLLILTLLWHTLRFAASQPSSLSTLEISGMLFSVAFFGWISPFGVTIAYCLFAQIRVSRPAGSLPRQSSTARTREAEVSSHPPRRQAGVPAPFVYGADKPWGWLVYCDGKFTGQELALKRAIISLGREEDNEIWLDDDAVSRYHAELAWERGQVFVTDAGSLNGVLLNGRRVRSSLLVKPGDELVIGSQRFSLKYAQQPVSEDLDDPLLPQLRRVAANRRTPGESPTVEKSPARPTVALGQNPGHSTPTPWAIHTYAPPDSSGMEKVEPLQNHSLPAPEPSAGLCLIRAGEMAGRSFLLDRPALTVGNGPASDVVIHQVSLAPVHLQFFHQADGDYVRDLAGRHNSRLNGLPLHSSHHLSPGDVIDLGEVQLEYALVSEAQTTPMLPVPPPQPETPIHFPFSLRLPSRVKE